MYGYDTKSYLPLYYICWFHCMFSRYARWNTEIFILLHVFTQGGGLGRKKILISSTLLWERSQRQSGLSTKKIKMKDNIFWVQFFCENAALQRKLENGNGFQVLELNQIRILPWVTTRCRHRQPTISPHTSSSFFRKGKNCSFRTDSKEASQDLQSNFWPWGPDF